MEPNAPVETRRGGGVLRNGWNVLLWAALTFGAVVNFFAFWVIVPEIGKELFRFDQVPDVSSSAGFFEWVKSFLTLSWLPKDALHVRFSRKLIFAACNVVFLVVVFSFYKRGERGLAIILGALALMALALVFSPAIGNL